ncbi:MAG: hypothetical protein LBK99_10415, partial [Opitutaceae bacterium]|nr:hypothetical protein [Opitutaceae bacterium]
VRTDLGSEFDGDTVHYRPDGFHRSITSLGALHRFNPPARPNSNADVESSHSTIEPEFFDLELFLDTASFIASASTYPHFFNFARKNRSRSNLAPADFLAMRSPLLPPRILLLPPVFLDSLLGQVLSGPPETVKSGRCITGFLRNPLNGNKSNDIHAGVARWRAIAVKRSRHACLLYPSTCINHRSFRGTAAFSFRE